MKFIKIETAFKGCFYVIFSLFLFLLFNLITAPAKTAMETKIMKLEEKKKTRKIKGSLYEYALINEKIPKPKKPIDENIPIMFLRI